MENEKDVKVSELTTEEQLDFYEDQLMAHLLRNFDENRLEMSRLGRDFFRNENFLLYRMLRTIASEKGVTVDIDYVRLYLQAHSNEFHFDKDRIEFAFFESDTQSDIQNLTSHTVEKFRTLTSSKFKLVGEFNDALSRFKQVYAGLELQDTLDTVATAVSDGVYYARKPYKGVTGGIELLKRKLGVLESLTSDEKTYTLKDASEDDYDAMSANTPVLLADFPDNPTLNKAMRGIRTNTLVTMVAPSKGMKSKVAVRVAHAVMMNGHNVCFWGKEGGDVKVKAELRATHFDHYYNVMRGKNYAKISATDIMFDMLEPNIKELEEVSWKDLFKSGRYGTLFTPDFPFKYEELENVIRRAGEEKGCKFVVVDYTQILESDTIHEQRIIIEKAYQKFESLKGLLNICLWTPAQMSSEAISEMGKTGKVTDQLVTSHSNEPIKSSDISFLAYTNDELAKKNISKIHYLPSRLFQPFESYDAFRDPVANRIVEIEGQSVEIINGEMKLRNKGEELGDVL